MPGRVAVVVLAAGGSARLGRPKQLIRFRDQTLLRRAADAALAAGCGPVIVVLGAHAPACRDELRDVARRLTLVENSGWADGIGGSIRTGVAAAVAGSPAAVLLMTCDQPLVDGDLLRRLVGRRAESGTDVVACAYAGTLGVPALFNQRWFPQLLSLPVDRGARDLIRACGSAVATEAFPDAAWDIDTPSDAAELYD